MNSLSAQCFVILSTIGIDIVARWALGRRKNQNEVKPAGLFSLLFLCLLQGQRIYKERSIIIKQFFLSLTMVVFMAAANYLLIARGAPNNTHFLGFALLVTPIFTLPFYHFLYGLLGIKPLSVDAMLEEFRVRGTIALVLSANVIFIALEPLQHILSLFIHFCLALLALVGTFYLCAHQRKRASVYQAPFQSIEYGLEPMLLRYVVALLEVLYSLVLIAEIFLRSALELFLARPFDTLSLLITIATLLSFAALFTRIRFLFGPVISLAFYEDRALPLSFLIFGVASIIRYYL